MTVIARQSDQSPLLRTRPGEDFEGQARAILTRQRRAVGRFLESLPEPIRRPADVQRVLGVDKVLGWRMFRLWAAADPFDAVPHVPRPGPLAKALRAGASRGVPEAVIGEVEAACAAFEAFVAEHAGDRGSFESMVAGLGAGGGQATARDRRAAFRAGSRLWGVFAHAQFACSILHPAARPGFGNWLLVAGYVGVQQLRRGVHLRVSHRSSLSLESDGGAGREPALGEGAPGPSLVDPDGLDLLREYCTQPLPSFIVRQTPKAVLETNLELSGLGRASSATYFLRRKIPDSPMAGEKYHGQNTISRIPTQVLYADVLLPEGRTDPSTAAARVYGNLFDVERGWDRNDADLLPVSETNRHLGHSLERLHTPDFPRYPEMIHSVLREAGWEKTRFDIYRCRVELPILHANVSVWAERRPG